MKLTEEGALKLLENFRNKVEKTIAILLQSIYTKEESGAKWRERPLIDSKVEGE